MEATTLSAASVYVGTYGKYNNGSLSGAWLDLSDYSDKEEFYEACRELHKDEEDAEYMFQDWENVPESLIGESWISENFFALRDAVEDLSDTEQEAYLTDRIALLVSARERALFGSDIGKFHTQVSLGLKFIIN